VTDRQWLRQLLEDEPSTMLDSTAASGTDTDFYVGSPPITAGSVTVAVNGSLITSFTIVDAAVVRFASPPAEGASVTIRYGRQTFADVDLDFYLSQARLDYSELRQIVYRAAVLALDSLLTGAATALPFGAGSETFDMVSVFDRLTKLRSIAASETTARPSVYVEPVLPPVVLVQLGRSATHLAPFLQISEERRQNLDPLDLLDLLDRAWHP